MAQGSESWTRIAPANPTVDLDLDIWMQTEEAVCKKQHDVPCTPFEETLLLLRQKETYLNRHGDTTRQGAKFRDEIPRLREKIKHIILQSKENPESYHPDTSTCDSDFRESNPGRACTPTSETAPRDLSNRTADCSNQLFPNTDDNLLYI